MSRRGISSVAERSSPPIDDTPEPVRLLVARFQLADRLRTIWFHAGPPTPEVVEKEALAIAQMYQVSTWDLLA